MSGTQVVQIGLSLVACLVVVVIATLHAHRAQTGRQRALAIAAGAPALAAWLLAPAWMAGVFTALALTPTAAVLRPIVQGATRSRRERQFVMDRLWRMSETPLPAASFGTRLRAYAEAAQLASQGSPVQLPAPPEDRQTQFNEATDSLALAWEAAMCAYELHRTGLANTRPYRRACHRIIDEATTLADMAQREEENHLPVRVPTGPATRNVFKLMITDPQREPEPQGQWHA